MLKKAVIAGLAVVVGVAVLAWLSPKLISTIRYQAGQAIESIEDSVPLETEIGRLRGEVKRLEGDETPLLRPGRQAGGGSGQAAPRRGRHDGRHGQAVDEHRGDAEQPRRRREDVVPLRQPHLLAGRSDGAAGPRLQLLPELREGAEGEEGTADAGRQVAGRLRGPARRPQGHAPRHGSGTGQAGSRPQAGAPQGSADQR